MLGYNQATSQIFSPASNMDGAASVICSSSWLFLALLDRILDWVGSWIGSLTAEEVDRMASMAGEATKIGTPRPE